MSPLIPPGGEVTIGEVYRGLTLLREEVRTGFEKIEKTHDDYVTRDEYSALGDRVTLVEQAKMWATRAVFGGIVAMLLTALSVVVFGPGAFG